MIELEDIQGNKVPQKLDLPLNTTATDLNLILQKIQSQPKKNYSFYYKTYEIQSNLKELLVEFRANKITSEEKLVINFVEESEFDIKPVTRISSSLEGHENAVLDIAFAPNNIYLASVSGDKTLRLWDVTTETPYVKLEGHGDWVLSLSWSPDCNFIATGDNSGLVIVWNIDEVLKNRKTIIKSQKDNVSDGLMYKKLLKGHSKFITSISWRPMHLEYPSTSFITSSKDGTLRIWNANMGNCITTCARHSKSVTKVIWGGEDLIYSASQDCKIMIWDKKGTYLRTLDGHSHWVNSLSLNTHHTIRAACYGFEKDGRPRFQQDSDKKALALDLYIKHMVIVKREVIVSGSDDNTVIQWENNKPKKLVGHSAPINHIQFAPNGILFITASFDKTLRLWGVFNDACLGVFRAHIAEVYMLAFSKDSKWVISGSKDSTLQVWSIKDKKRAYQLPGHADEVYAVDWSPDGLKLASGGKDRMVRIWKN